ncbi:hypothetical protein RhiirA5_440719 [Rhizophagus irregularis]|uniref:Uncharacterized protein n=1 Tax=Rhizophagus irregularis TaxID=588596 RepID=A0A2N0NGC7_9GLOM|nr:hypothetical protein RhiirA5_440719 [Rhizophagus irregularis]
MVKMSSGWMWVSLPLHPPRPHGLAVPIWPLRGSGIPIYPPQSGTTSGTNIYTKKLENNRKGSKNEYNERVVPDMADVADVLEKI